MIDKRVECLDNAKEYVTRDRASAYGQPEDNFKAIADIWTAQGVTVDGRGVQPYDVALMMIGMKIARLRHNPTHEDSWTDTAGYAACGMRAAHVADNSTAAEKEGEALGVTDAQRQDMNKMWVDTTQLLRRFQPTKPG